MQTFFNKLARTDRLAPHEPVWEYARAGLQRNLDNVIKYYQNRPFAAKSNHLLAKMLNTLGVGYQHEVERFYDIVDARSMAIAMSNRLTSSVHSGQLFDGVFYGPGNHEVIMAHSEYISPFKIVQDWKNTQAVTVLTHPKSDLDLLLPIGKETSPEKGVAVISINIPVLALQYKCYLHEQHEYSITTGNSPRGIGQFLHMYVLPNMLPSHLDVALFNRAVNFTTGAPMGVSTKRHAFMLPSYNRQVDAVYRDLTRFIHQNDRPFSDIMKSFPAVSAHNFEVLQMLPNQAPTKQVAWAEVVARLKTLDWLTQISPTHGMAHNASEMNYLRRLLYGFARDGTMRTILNTTLQEDAQAAMREIDARIRQVR